MTTYYFVGGEDSDFTRFGNTAVNTALTAARRTTYARCSLSYSDTLSNPSGGWGAVFSSSLSTFWFTTQAYFSNASGDPTFWTATSIGGPIRFHDAAGIPRLVITNNNVSPGNWALKKISSTGGLTVLFSSAIGIAITALSKLSVYVNYAVAGNVKFYVDNTLVIDYSGDVTTNGVTALDSFMLGLAGRASGTTIAYYSEVICASTDTRGMSLVTLPLLANGNTFAWTGATADISETTLDDQTTITSGTANQVAQSTVTSTGLAGSPAIMALAVNARAVRGSTGPQNIQANVRTGAVDYFSSTIPLTLALEKTTGIWETNPNTTAAWLPADITVAGFNIGVKSII